jgi:hypothetical protein
VLPRNVAWARLTARTPGSADHDHLVAIEAQRLVHRVAALAVDDTRADREGDEQRELETHQRLAPVAGAGHRGRRAAQYDHWPRAGHGDRRPGASEGAEHDA